jgi:LysM repeat protein
MQITHEEARRLIQFNADEALRPQEKILLSTHINSCLECRAYAEEIKEVEKILLPAMQRQWNVHPLPLLISDLSMRRAARVTGSLLAIRTVIMSFVFVMLVFSAWQFTRSGQQLRGLPPVMVAPVSTPSIESTNTTVSSRSCDAMHYNVQANDTLTSIADQFSISKDEIIAMNGLKTDRINLGMTLMIPVCNFTPTSTLSPTTTTYAPVISSATSSPAPDGY